MDIIIVNKKVIALENGKSLGKMTFNDEEKYLIIDNTIILEEEVEGIDVCEKLVAALVEYARDRELKVVSKCNFANIIFGNNIQYQDIILN